MSTFKLPPVAADRLNVTDRRNREKLQKSPGSYFVGRARQLVLAAPYFYQRLREGAYGGTASGHYANLCGASYIAILGAFELMWRTLFARIVDLTDLYDADLLDNKAFRDAVNVEMLLAHREETSVGAVIAASLGTWQRSEVVNRFFQSALQVQPISGDDADLAVQLSQLRHVIAHGAGIVSSVDAYRLGGGAQPDTVLRIDKDYLEYTEGHLVQIVRDGVRRVADRVMSDWLRQRSTRSWASDQETFSKLYLLGAVVGRATDLPEVTEADYEKTRERLLNDGGTPHEDDGG